jgi:hypothetical protein
MARKTLEGTQYTFNPSTKQISISRYIPRERLVLITNVTKNKVIYNFSDPSLKASSYTATVDGNDSSTEITLVADTTTMSASDVLMITIDEFSETFTPSETFKDPIDKLRVSQPQSLIDTDFEYGPQITKWENLALMNFRPFAYSRISPVSGISSVTMPNNSRVVTVTTSAAHGLTAGTPINVMDTFFQFANGNFVIETAPTTTTFTYTANSTNTSAITAIFDTNKTMIFAGEFYSGAAIGGSTAPTMSYSGREVTVTTAVPHGLALGNEIAITGVTATTNAPNGSFVVSTIVSATQFRYFADAVPTGTLNATAARVYVRPQGQFLHRANDGGVIFSPNSLSNYQQAIRQTRRYFRYQSGKGIQVSSGTILKPNLQIDSLTASGTTITVRTKESHNLSAGVVVNVSGANETAYNGNFEVTSVTGFNTFTYSAIAIPSQPVASGDYSVSISSWNGCAARLGIFDDQNGMFFEYDGKKLYVVRRTSTYQLSGRVTVTNGSNTVTQTSTLFPTYFSKQLNIGDFIVIRGQSYTVTDVASDTSLTISPSYRGATADNAIYTKTVDFKIPQEEWNLDKMDGTGPSGFDLNLTKMQMFYIDYSWYGAGYIRWGLRGSNGDITYVHKIANNNVNNEAYMRSGNLPARYEVNTFPMVTRITSTLNSGDSTVNVADTSQFPSSGTLCIRNANTYEFVNYTNKTATSFTGLTRGRAGETGGSFQITSILAGSASGTVASSANLQAGMRVLSDSFPENTYIVRISGNTVFLSKAALVNGPITVIIAPMGATTGQTFTFSATDPVAVEYAFPDLSSYLSHWGTSVIMDGRFDEDKSLLFTYGQTSVTTIPSGQTRSLFAIRLAPSVDSGVGSAFGSREVINRMQLVLRELGLTIRGGSGNALVTAVLNGVPSTSVSWISSTTSGSGFANSSLAQIAPYPSASNVSTTGGEIVAGFYVGSGAQTLDLSELRDLGNSILGGGGPNSGTQIYPDGPDTLTINVTNLAGSGNLEVLGRLTWTEAQA